MHVITWPVRTFKAILAIYKTRKGLWVINIVGSIIFTVIGALIYSLFLATAPISYWSKIAIVLSSGVGGISVILVVIERIFQIELHYRQLDLTGVQIEKAKVDVKSVSQEVADKIVDIVKFHSV